MASTSPKHGQGADSSSHASWEARPHERRIARKERINSGSRTWVILGVASILIGAAGLHMVRPAQQLLISPDQDYFKSPGIHPAIGSDRSRRTPPIIPASAVWLHPEQGDPTSELREVGIVPAPLSATQSKPAMPSPPISSSPGTASKAARPGQVANDAPRPPAAQGNGSTNPSQTALIVTAPVAKAAPPVEKSANQPPSLVGLPMPTGGPQLPDPGEGERRLIQTLKKETSELRFKPIEKSQPAASPTASLR